MLNKDEYNQEEYNEYYRQETGRAETKNKDEKSGILGKLILLLILFLLTIAGYFGYKSMNPSTTNSTDSVSKEVTKSSSSLPQTIQKESDEVAKDTTTKEALEIEKKITEASKKEETKKEVTKELETEEKETSKKEALQEVQEKKANSEQLAVTSEVNKALSSQGKMSPEEISAVVDAVMKQLNQKKSTDTVTESVASKKDALLIDELSNSEVDSVSADLIKDLENVDISEDTKIDNSKKQIDVYNKVSVQGTSDSDTLSELSKQISSVIAEGVNKDKTATYTKSLKSEVTVRTNEMRIIVVKKGDTLGKIAKRAYGNVMEFKKIYQANPELTRPDRIYIGQKLRIPN